MTFPLVRGTWYANSPKVFRRRGTGVQKAWNRRGHTMKIHLTLLAAGAIIFATSLATASPPSGGMVGGHAPTTTMTTTTPPTSGNGGGYNHMNSPAHVTGQPSQSCQTTGSTPGNAGAAPGSAFNPSGTAGSNYAGTQPQNSRNTASVSQYDVACANQPH